MTTRGSPACDMTMAPLSLFIDGVAGNDNNDGSAASPLATLTEFEHRIPMSLEHDVLGTVVSAGTYTCPTFNPTDHLSGAG